MNERNAAAGLALRERREELLAFHRLNVPATLNVTFLSTNLIENVLRNCLSPRLTGASPFGQPAAGQLAVTGSKVNH